MPVAHDDEDRARHADDQRAEDDGARPGKQLLRDLVGAPAENEGDRDPHQEEYRRKLRVAPAQIEAAVEDEGQAYKNNGERSGFPPSHL